MLRRSLVLLVLLASARAELDLTPRSVESQFGAYAVSRIIFRDGDKQFAVRLDSDAEVNAEQGGAMFRYKNIPQASVALKPSRVPPGTGFEGDGLVIHQRAAAQMLPATAEEVKLEARGPGESPLPDSTSYGFTFVYRVAQSLVRERIDFLTLSTGQQIVVHVGALKKDFDAVNQRMERMFQRWHEFRPDRNLNEN